MHRMIVMMGGQGVGKGTFSKMLMERGDYCHIETGGLLRNAPPESEVAKTIARGDLVPDEMLYKLIGEIIDHTAADIIMDGFPRTIPQAEWLVRNYAHKFAMHVIYLNVPESVMKQRIEKRIREGGGRADDADAAAVRKRLDTFWRVTVPAIDCLRESPGVQFSEVSVSDTNADINFQKIERALGAY